MTLSRLNEQENALRAYTYSLKLDPTDPMALLNYAIFQTNTGVSRSKIDTTLEQFCQYYNERAASTNQQELDTSMLNIAKNLGAPIPTSADELPSTVSTSPMATRVQHEEENAPSTSISIFSPRQPQLTAPGDEDTSKTPTQELPVVKTKIFDDGRRRNRRAHQLPTPSSNVESAQNDEQEESTAF